MRARPRYLQKHTTRHGKVAWYVRMDDGPKIRIRGPYGSREFNDAYDAAVSGKKPTPPGLPAEGTVEATLALYRASQKWRDLSVATRRQRENIFRQVVDTAGGKPVSAIGVTAIEAGINRRSGTPAQSRHFLDTMRGFFLWAVHAKHIREDPTAGFKVAKPKTKGFPEWTAKDVALFERRWPAGTRERLMFDVFRYAGLRRGDAARLSMEHIKDDVIVMDTEKTGTRVEIPMLPELLASLKLGPLGSETIIASLDGKPMRKESVGNLFSEVCREAGILKSAHGLRKLAATNLANHGATVAELEAIFGWEGGRMASLYTRSADRRALAKTGMGKLKGGTTAENNP